MGGGGEHAGGAGDGRGWRRRQMRHHVDGAVAMAPHRQRPARRARTGKRCMPGWNARLMLQKRWLGSACAYCACWAAFHHEYVNLYGAVIADMMISACKQATHECAQAREDSCGNARCCSCRRCRLGCLAWSHATSSWCGNYEYPAPPAVPAACPESPTPTRTIAFRPRRSTRTTVRRSGSAGGAQCTTLPTPVGEEGNASANGECKRGVDCARVSAQHARTTRTHARAHVPVVVCM